MAAKFLFVIRILICYDLEWSNYKVYFYKNFDFDLAIPAYTCKKTVFLVEMDWPQDLSLRSTICERIK